jgi:hypothetical protein
MDSLDVLLVVSESSISNDHQDVKNDKERSNKFIQLSDFLL